MEVTQGSLTMVGLNTSTPKVFWNGKQVPGIVHIRVDWEDGEQNVKLKVNGNAYDLYLELASAGITVKQEKQR